ncbi:MAG: site-specific integrase [Tannerellaceae bacterium]|nr:site-specific integrase [Tannerellaceae bacterium]
MLSIEIHFRASRRRGADYGKLFIRLIYARKTGSLTLPYVIRKTDWDKLSARLHSSSFTPLTKEERFLVHEKNFLFSIAGELRDKGLLSVPAILAVYRMRKKKKGLGLLVEELSDDLISRGKERTARAYRTTWRMLQAYLGREEICVEDITPELLSAYEAYMRSVRKSLNTISFYMRNLRAIYNKGIKCGYFPFREDNPFRSVYTKVAPTRKRALSKEELRRLENLLDDPAPVLDKEEKRALSLFLFSFHSRGMCFVDLAYLRKEDIKDNMIRYYRKKTGQYMEIRLTAPMRKYMKYASGGCLSPYQFFVLTPGHRLIYTQYCTGLRRQNRLLKEIGRKAGLTQPLTTHMARHSWATVAKMEQIPVEIISEALGHSRLDTTYRYLGSFGETVLDKANRKVTRAIRAVG